MAGSHQEETKKMDCPECPFLAQFNGVPAKGLKPAEPLFAAHTYYALFMKLLASEIVAFFQAAHAAGTHEGDRSI